MYYFVGMVEMRCRSSRHICLFYQQGIKQNISSNLKKAINTVEVHNLTKLYGTFKLSNKPSTTMILKNSTIHEFLRHCSHILLCSNNKLNRVTNTRYVSHDSGLNDFLLFYWQFLTTDNSALCMSIQLTKSLSCKFRSCW